MPRLSDSMEEGTVVRWLKEVGESVSVGEELVEIETDKANMVYEADGAGTLTEILIGEGEAAPIGAEIAFVGERGDDSRKEKAGRQAAKIQPSPADANHEADGETPSPRVATSATRFDAPASNGRVKASPLARRIAKDLEVDLSAVTGSGPGGRIVKADVENARLDAGVASSVPRREGDGLGPTRAPETAKGSTSLQQPNRLQEVVARRMAESKATVPHFYLTTEIEMDRAVEARERIRGMVGEDHVVPSFNDMIVKACAMALRESPRANGAYRDGHFELYSRVNVGVAVAAPDSLVVPTIFDADRKGLTQIARETRELAAKVRAGTITPPELSGGTFTVSNLGMYGVRKFGPVISTPQAAILAVGAIEARPAVRAGTVVAAQLMEVTLACDHRILYGADGAQFLSRVKALLEEPVSLSF